MDDKTFGHSIAITVYLANIYGFYGETNLDRLSLDEVNHAANDLFRLAWAAIQTSDNDEKKQMVDSLADKVPSYLQYFEDTLEASNTDFFLGSNITVSDICVYDILWRLQVRGLASVENFPKVDYLMSLVEQRLANVNFKRGEPLY
ncbi:glutathione S-transferase [Aplysia californica]|uniref:Glutathione S-transferase n=1 Tax=Aplysia californica TaxID=6500 RepID=A0ABM1A9D2_APLCA|nr:glutathione S-transferase [Aplysia californica]